MNETEGADSSAGPASETGRILQWTPSGPPAGASAAGPGARASERVAFDRRELQTILNVYGRRVAEGEWRDYAMDFSPAKAVFSIFRRASEFPLYRIEKIPELAQKQGAYCVLGADGRVLKRGRDLARVLSCIDRALKIVR